MTAAGVIQSRKTRKRGRERGERTGGKRLKEGEPEERERELEEEER